MSQRSLTCTACGGTDFRIVHADGGKQEPSSIYALGTICAGCGRRSLIVWRMDPEPDPAGGIAWA